MSINVTCKLVDITPTMANEWLADKWGEQRNVRTNHIKRLANDMRNKLFKISPDAILRIKGKLANGQHRLSAVSESGTTQTFIVMESDDEELYKVVDAGVKRSASDALIGHAYAGHMPAVVRWLMAYDMQRIYKQQNSGSKAIRESASQIEIVNYCQDHGALLTEAISYCSPLYQATRLLPLAVSAAIYCICANKDSATLDTGREFLQNLYVAGGENAAGDLRNRLIGGKGSRAKMPSGFLMGLTLKALKSFINGTRPGSLRWDDGEPLTVI